MDSGDIVDPKTAPQFQEKANEIAAILRDKIEAATGKAIDSLGRTSGGKVEASLTQTYLDHGVKSTEAKADVEISGIGVSVKKYEDSQFVSAQGPELAAIFDVAMRRNQKLIYVLRDELNFL